MGVSTYSKALTERMKKRFGEDGTLTLHNTNPYPQKNIDDYKNFVADWSGLMREKIEPILAELKDIYTDEMSDMNFFRGIGVRNDENNDFEDFVSEYAKQKTGEIDNDPEMRQKVNNEIYEAAKATKYPVVDSFGKMIQQNIGESIDDEYFDDDLYGDIVDDWTLHSVESVHNIPAGYILAIALACLAAYHNGKSADEMYADCIASMDKLDARNLERAADGMIILEARLNRRTANIAGLDRYVWRTMMDDKVRDSHRSLEGSVVYYDMPPADGLNAGEDFGCRCYAEPIVDFGTFVIPLIDDDEDFITDSAEYFPAKNVQRFIALQKHLTHTDNSIIINVSNEDGGKGSGNWGHAGRIGQVGGSAGKGEGSGSVANRYMTSEGTYTSFAKERKKVATPHQTNATELKEAPIGTKLIVDGNVYTKSHDTKWTDKDGNEIGSYTLNKEKCWEKQIKLAIPKSAEAEFMAGKGEKGKVVEKPAKPAKKKSGEVFDTGGYGKRHDTVTKLKDNEALKEFKTSIEDGWSKMSSAERTAAYRYTEGSKYINEPLHQIKYMASKTGALKDIKNLTSAIEKNVIPHDVILYHELDSSGFEKMTGTYLSSYGSHDSLKGMVAMDDAFVSCSAHEGGGYEGGAPKDVVMEIFVPKGAKGIYAEPFSEWGKGAKSVGWDGKVTQTKVSHEDEIVLQRGGAYKINDVEYTDGKWHIKCELVGQNPDSISEETYKKYAKK